MLSNDTQNHRMGVNAFEYMRRNVSMSGGAAPRRGQQKAGSARQTLIAANKRTQYI